MAILFEFCRIGADRGLLLIGNPSANAHFQSRRNSSRSNAKTTLTASLRSRNQLVLDRHAARRRNNVISEESGSSEGVVLGWAAETSTGSAPDPADSVGTGSATSVRSAVAGGMSATATAMEAAAFGASTSVDNSAAATGTSAPKTTAEAGAIGRSAGAATTSWGQVSASEGALADITWAETEGRTTTSGASGTRSVGREVGSPDLLQSSASAAALGRASAPPWAAKET